MAGADYEQLEFRVAGALAEDRQIALDVLQGTDVHAVTAGIIFPGEWKGREARGGDELRTKAKAHTFKPLYGGSSGTPEQQDYYKLFRDKYPAVAAMQRRWVDECIETGQLRTASGLISYFPGTDYTWDGKHIKNYGKILNLPVQQLATADLAPLGVTLLWHALRDNHARSFIVNEVHDSAIAEVHPEEVVEFEALCKESMVTRMVVVFQKVTGVELTIPLDIEVKFNTHWT